MERKAMLQSHLLNKICSLPQHTPNSMSCHSSSFYLKLLEQITVGGGAYLRKVFMIKVWQYLKSWSNKSMIMACFSLALLKKKCHPIFIKHLSSCFPKSVLLLIPCRSNPLLKWSAFICPRKSAQHVCFLLKPHPATLMQLHTLMQSEG